MEGLSPAHLILILIVALLILGPGKLPEAGAALGRSLREFRAAMSDTEPVPPSPPTVPPPTVPPPAAPPSDG